jgi:hypothetical protein
VLEVEPVTEEMEAEERAAALQKYKENQAKKELEGQA